MRGTEVLEQLRVRGRLLQRVQLAAVQVLQQGVTQQVVVRGVADDRRDGLEAGLLRGALQKNRGLAFLCQEVVLVTANNRSALTTGVSVGTRLRIPINHFEGCFTADPEVLAALEDRGQVVVRYADNPNGSAADIAGVCNEAGNVVGLMPHPERASHDLLGSEDGNVLLAALLSCCGRSLPG